MSTVLLEDILRLVELQLGQLGVRAQDRLAEDLGAESLDMVNLAAAVDEKFGVFLKESEIARVFTPQDLHDLIREKLDGS